MVAFFSLQIFAHEGHNETSLKSLHGGMVKKTNSAFIEVVQDDGKIEIFITGHDYKNLADQKLVLKAVAQIKDKTIPLDLLLEKDHYIVKTDLKKRPHFKLTIALTIAKKEENVSFSLEN